jgi:dolichyl-phosphate beta-glucosyltransferase
LALPQSLSLIIPAFNEQQRLLSFLEPAHRFLKDHVSDFEILVVDDGSTDETVATAIAFANSHPEIRVIELGHNQGKGKAVRTGMLAARCDYKIFADADGSTPIEEVRRLHHALSTGSADIAIGSRALSASGTRVVSRLGRRVLGRVFNFAVNILVVPGIRDTQCGFKLFTHQAAEQVFSRCSVDGFSFDIEVLFLANKLGLTVVEVPVNWTHVAGSKVRVLKDGIQMFITALSVRFRH